MTRTKRDKGIILAAPARKDIHSSVISRARYRSSSILADEEIEYCALSDAPLLDHDDKD
jgi:hypothetical protein